ncbi:MAG: M23 family metallopeptidase [Caldilineaceae bacterium]
MAGGELDVYLLYGHLNEVTVSQGQHVEVGDLVGKVGMTGIAIGPHLHVEMRLGANTYDNSVNPYLWLKPLDNGGAVAVRLLTADGRAWPGGRASIVRYGNGGVSLRARHVETHLNDENLGPDPVWGENGAMGSVPPGSYLVIANVNGESLRTQINVEAGHTTFVELRTTQ